LLTHRTGQKIPRSVSPTLELLNFAICQTTVFNFIKYVRRLPNAIGTVNASLLILAKKHRQYLDEIDPGRTKNVQ